MTNLTNLEAKVLKATHAFWNYGDASEKDDNAVMVNAQELAGESGLPVATVRGAMGSLHKKGMMIPMEGGPTGNVIESGITDEGIDAVLEMLAQEENDLEDDAPAVTDEIEAEMVETPKRKPSSLLVVWNKDLTLSIFPAGGGKRLMKTTMWHTDKSWLDAVAPFCEGWFGTDNRDEWRVRCTVAK